MTGADAPATTVGASARRPPCVVPVVTGVEGFATVARRLADAARAAGLRVPAFRSPPRVPGATRTLRRYPGGTVVSVRLRDRAFDAVIADMVEGVIVANRMSGEAALRTRTYLAEAVADLGAEPGAETGAESGGGVPGPARVGERQTRAA